MLWTRINPLYSNYTKSESPGKSINFISLNDTTLSFSID